MSTTSRSDPAPPPDEGEAADAAARPVPPPAEGRPRWYRGWTWPAISVAVVLAAIAPVLVGASTLAHRDTARLYASLRGLVVEALRHGELPLWDPYEFTGKPLFAEGVHAVLHPISLAAALVAPSALDVALVGFLVAAALGAYALARALAASEPAAGAAAVAYALSGFTLSMTGNLPFLAGASTLPWIVLAGRAAGKGQALGPAAVALATAAGFFSGDVQVTGVGVALALALAWDAGAGRGVARAALGVGAGVLVASIQIAPSWAMLAQTERAGPLAELDARRWPLEPARLLEWVAPGLFSLDPETRRAPAYLALGGATDRPHPFAESVHLGAALLVLAWIGARGRTGKVVAIAGVAVTWLAMGYRGGAGQLLGWVPVWNRFRYPEKLMVPVGLCAAVLAARGIDELRRRGASRGETIAGATLAALAAAGAAVALAVGARAPSGAADAFVARRVAVGLALAAAGFALAAALPVALGSRRRWIPAALAAAVAAQALAASPFAEPLHPARMRDFAPAVSVGAAPPGPRLYHPYQRELRRYEDLEAFDADMFVERLTLAPPANVAAGVDDFDGYSGFEPRRWRTLSGAVFDAAAAARRLPEEEPRRAGRLGAAAMRGVLARRFAATHVVLFTPWNEYTAVVAEGAVEGGIPLQAFTDPELEIWEVPHRAWAFFATAAVAVRGFDEAIAATRDLVASGDDYTVAVEAPSVPPTAPGRVYDVERGLRTVRIDGETEADGLLVVNDAFWPGWIAELDGAPTEILAADALVRAVRWPAGRHTLVMTYRPPEVRYGLAGSIVGAIAVLSLAVVALRRRTAGGPTGP